MNLSLTKLPWYAQIGAFAVLAIGGVGAFYYFYEMPAQAAMAQREEQLIGLQRNISIGLATAKKLPEFRAQINDLENRLMSLRAVLPDEKDAADLLRRMQTVATQSNLSIKSFTPKATVTKQMHAEWPISLELDGTYHNLALFFDRVGKFTRIVNISGLEVKAKPNPDARATITATCTATTFVLLDQPVPAKPGAKPGAASKPKPGAAPKPGAPKV
jgi:type IV pilus assembly protein PilO